MRNRKNDGRLAGEMRRDDRAAQRVSIESPEIKLMDALAERSKAVAQGAIPKGRRFEPHSCHFLLLEVMSESNRFTR